jgi:transcriptional regulator with XRE-family HTH domain
VYDPIHARSAAVTRQTAGGAVRDLREARDWSLADFAEVTGVSIMGLSFLERGARKPHKSTVQKVENGLGLPPGTYARWVLNDADRIDLDDYLQPVAAAEPGPAMPRVVVTPPDTDLVEQMAAAQVEAMRSVIDRLPARSSNEYETYIHSVLEQSVKFELLAANSWRVAVNAGADAAAALMGHLQELEAIRSQLLALLPDSLSSRLDLACARSPLPEPVIAALLGVSNEQLWAIRNQGAIPPGAVDRVKAFVDADGTASPLA